jgi:hypothetical protein
MGVLNMNSTFRVVVTGVASIVYLYSPGPLRVFADDEARPIRVIPYPELKARLDGADPLPKERTWQRLKRDGIDDAAAYVQNLQKSKSYLSRIDHYREQTLVIEWDGVPGARWALNVEGHLSSLPTGKVRLPPSGWKRFRWQRDGDQKCTLIYENDDPKASLHVLFHAKQDHVDYSLTVQADDQTRDHVATHLCFNHCWADGFGRDALVLTDDRVQRLGDIPNPERIWIRVATLADPTYAKLKREQFAKEGIGGNLNDKRLTGPAAEKIKVPIGDVQGRFIATQRAGDGVATVAINSPDAISVGWSFWPCTDIDLAIGTVRPREPKTVAGRIWFLKGGIDKALDTIRVSAK